MAATERPLTPGERRLAASIFASALDCDPVRIHRRKWFAFHPKRAIMAPDGHIWVHPKSGLWCDDYAGAPLPFQALFLHEMTHVWQAQTRGRWYLPTRRHPFCRYAYRFEPGRPFRRYGVEQQAEIVRHVFLLRRNYPVPGAPPLAALESVLPFSST